MKKVMIVDDSVSMRQMVSYTLRQGGFEVIEAEHGQDALNKLVCATVDLILTDLNMPVMDGITLIQNVRKQPAMKSKPRSCTFVDQILDLLASDGYGVPKIPKPILPVP